MDDRPEADDDRAARDESDPADAEERDSSPAANDGERTDERPDRDDPEDPNERGSPTDGRRPNADRRPVGRGRDPGEPTDVTEDSSSAADREDAEGGASGADAGTERPEAVEERSTAPVGVEPGDGDADDSDAGADEPMPDVPDPDRVPEDVRKYERFKKMDGAQYERVNEFLRDRTYVTAREWAIARLCADFRTETGVEMTKIGENLPELVPFMTDTYTPQAVNQARSSFDDKVRKAGATFLYGAMCDFYTAEELDDVMYEVTEVSKFLLEVEGVDLSVDDELEAEERISSVMREVREASKALREEEAAADDGE